MLAGGPGSQELSQCSFAAHARLTLHAEWEHYCSLGSYCGTCLPRTGVSKVPIASVSFLQAAARIWPQVSWRLNYRVGVASCVRLEAEVSVPCGL